MLMFFTHAMAFVLGVAMMAIAVMGQEEDDDE
jgi:hypothetical protein